MHGHPSGPRGPGRSSTKAMSRARMRRTKWANNRHHVSWLERSFDKSGPYVRPLFFSPQRARLHQVAMNATAHSISGRITGDTSLVATGGMPMRVQFALSRGAGARPIGSLGMVSDRSRPFEPFDPRPRNAALHDGRRRENRVGSPGMAVLYCRWHLDCAKLFQWRLPPRILVAVNRFEMPQELQKCRSCARNVSPNRGGRPL
jgi:hypothetical protein